MSVRSWWYDDGGWWRTRSLVLFWTAVALLVVGAIVFVVAYAYPTWWEEHKTERGRGDSPVTGIIQEPEVPEGGDPVDGIVAIEMPDDFSNFATRCVWEGYRGFTTSNDGGAFIVPDPNCAMPEVLSPEEVEE